MNVYRVTDQKTGKTGTCDNIKALSQLVGENRYSLMLGKGRYKIKKIGGTKLRKEYKDIDDMYEWMNEWVGSKKVTTNYLSWITAERRNRPRFVTTRTCMTEMLMMSIERYGTYEELDAIISGEEQPPF